MCIMKGVLAALEGNPVRLKNSKGPGVTAQFDSTVNSDIKFAYCTELLIRTDGKKQYRKQLIDKLMKIGDSLLVIEDSGIIKIHVHSNEPWNVMKTASAAGEFIRIKIENMKEQHNEIFGEMDENEADAGLISPDEAPTDYAVIAVSPGKGFDEILRGLGVNYIISGGQTMNPSTQQFIDIHICYAIAICQHKRFVANIVLSTLNTATSHCVLARIKHRYLPRLGRNTMNLNRIC